jgi:hypothetical protein
MTISRILSVFFGAVLLQLGAAPLFAQQVPLDVGTTVAGFQDDFAGALNPNWVVRGANVYSVSGGMLRVASASGDPNHLLYEVAGYDNTIQEVLVRIRVTNFGSGDGPRGGIATGIDPATSRGINLHFRDEPALGQRHIEFLDDALAWGTEFPFAWQNNVWYWLRLRHEPNAASQGGVNDVFAKIWLADGSQPEPAAWQAAYDYIPTRTTRTGFAGITACSLGGTAEFDVDYLLIKATGLPNITVAPNAFVQTPVAITNQPQSMTVLDCRPVTFTVGASGNPVPTLQWFRNNGSGFNPIPNATNSSYTIPVVQIPDDGSQFRVIAQNVISNVTYSATSSVATLTIPADYAPPRLIEAAPLGLTQVRLSFDVVMDPVTTQEPTNYRITNSAGSVLISNAVLETTGTNVLLTCAPMTEGATYTLVVSFLRDVCGEEIPADTTVAFTVSSYVAQNIGNAQPPGTSIGTNGGYNISGGGADIGGTNDQFQFAWQQRTGDFDVKVRIASLSLSDSWAEAGMMARETLASGGRFASVMATPSISGCYFQSRGTTNGATTLSGSFPANYPNTWLRLRRVGNQFNGFASYDGQSWSTLGSATVAMPASIYFGFAVSSHNTNQLTTAAFRDVSNVITTTTNTLPLNIEPLGQSSRRTSLVISEIMYHPAERPDGKNTEFVELFNALGEPQDISGYRLSGEVEYTFPANTILPSGAFLVVARVPADVQSIYGITGVLGPFENTNNLANDAGTIRLRHRTGAVFLEANYSSDFPYPASADGAGHSLVLARPSHGEGNPLAWSSSDSVDGSPGRLDPVTLDPLRNVLINEVLAHTDDPEKDYIELYNHSNDPIDISGCFLSDDRSTNKFIVPPNTIIPARGFAVFYETNLNFALSSHGETIYFRNAANTRVVDSVRFGAQENGVSLGRFPNGAANFYRMAAKTPAASNGPPRISDIVINEIMYNPISGDSDDEYIELYNRGTNTIDLNKWRLSGGISHTFRAGTVIPPNSYLVVANNVTRLLGKYSHLHGNNTVGNYDGSLANSSERIALSRPDFELATNGLGQLVTNTYDIIVNEVTYRDGGRWGPWSDGGGSSLELIDARADNRLAANWADSDETAKGTWTPVSVPGVLDNGTTAADQLQVLLQAAGECLIDNVEVLTSAGANLIANSTFEGGATGWTAEGTQEPSGWETAEGFGSARSYHVRATDRGDNQINRIRTPLTVAQSAGVTNTIRARVRWLRGHPEILFRLRGNWLEAAVKMDLPPNLGTPGLPNSRRVPNAAPAIYDVTHSPLVPAANEPVVVTARAHDPDSVPSIQLRYRIDPNATLTTVDMLDSGTGGDAVAGDGLYSATIPGQTANTLVAFRVQATDGFAPNATATFPNNAPTRECLVRFGESVPTGNFPSYRIWMTQATFSTWDARNNLNNTLNDVTFVLGNHRVIYNAGAVYAGSPYIAPGFNTPTGNRCGYAIEFPSDESFLGDNGLNLDWPGGHGNENTAVQEQMAYWLTDQMSLPFSHRYFIRLAVNGVTDMQRGGVFEAAIQPGTDFLKQWSPDDNEGDFFRIDRAFEFNDGGGRIADPEPQLRVYTTPDLVNGGTKKKTETYRWMWLKRSFESANDYTNLFAMADALNTTSPEPYTSHTEAMADVEEWMGIFAAEHIINNFDSWGHDIGKNMYMFFPRNSPARIYMFDLDWLMLVAAGSYPPTSGPLFISDDPTVTRMYNHPPFRRAYFRAVQAAVSNAFDQPKYEAVMDAKYNSLVANGITMCDGQTLVGPAAVKTWFSQRRGFLVGQMNAVASPFTVSGPTTITTNSTVVTISGTASFNIKTIAFNGLPYPVTWTTISNWTARVPLVMATTPITILGYDRDGIFVNGASNRIAVNFTGTREPALGNIVINEIMFRGALEESEYIELFNQATNTTFDLSNWRVNGLDYTFPEGSLIGPRAFLVLAKNRSMFAVRYGIAVPVFDEFSGDLQPDGETISLLDTNGVIIDRVRYEPSWPWPATANGTGSSYQLIDAQQENARAGNWFSSYVPPVLSGGVSTPAQTNAGWRFASVSGNIGAGTAGGQMRLMIYLGTELGSALIDDVSVVAGTNAEVGYNYVRNGDFESAPLLENPALTNSWQVGTNYTNTVIVGGLVHGGSGALRIAASSFGNGVPRIISQLLSPAPDANTTNTLSFWYWATNSSTNLTVRVLNSAQVSITTNINITITPSNYVPPVVVRPATNYLSPGAANQGATNLPQFPTLWINEVQTDNINGITDSFGEHEPWIEIYNAGTNAVSLEGLFLSDNYTNLTRWTCSGGPSCFIAPQEFKVVFCDGQPAQSTLNEAHTSFRSSSGSGSIVLSRVSNGATQVLDYVNYAGLTADHSYGSFPDGQPFDRQEFFYVTPRGTNDGRSAPLTVFINEWMAANTNALADPADDDYDDWFEIYNPSTNAVSLAGYFLTDVVSNRFKFEITTNMAHMVPPRGRLLVWADNETGQNLSGGVARPDMHVNFQLSQSGEAIGLFAADGSTVDVVTFTNQVGDVSEGRCPDGTANIISMVVPTPRVANLGCAGNNTAPVLAPIGNKIIYVGQTLSFNASANDVDAPPQILTFSIDVVTPLGAVMNPGTGLFTWTPAPEQAPSTNLVTVRVRDDGVPVLEDWETITIVVSLPPGFTSARRNGSNLELTWQTRPGKSYRVEYTDGLAPPAWQALGNDLLASGGTLSITNGMFAPQRFFRIKVVD